MRADSPDPGPEPVRDLAESTALPRVDPRAHTALNRLYDARAAPFSVTLGGEVHRLQWVHEEDASTSAHHSYPFRFAGHAGVISLDLPTQIALFGERRPERLPPELRLILLANATQDVVDGLLRATRSSFEWLDDGGKESAAARGDPHPVFFRTTVGSERPDGGWRGHVRFDDASAWADLAPPLGPGAEPAGDRLAHLRFPLCFRLGATRIRLREVRGIEAGDIVGVDDWTAAGSAIVVHADVGGARGRHLVALADGARITIQQTKDNATMNRDPHALTPSGNHAQDAAAAPIDRLDAMEVTLRFEVGDLEVTLGELRNLGAGHVFDLGQPLNRSVVRILAHGNLLGKGHLVAVGDRLGVRVTEFAPNAI